jgi:solute carrier family 25 protein 14/30
MSGTNGNATTSGKAAVGGVGGVQMYVFGGLSAQVAAVFTNPIDVIKIRLQLQGEGHGWSPSAAGLYKGQHRKGIVEMFISVVKEEGLLALWKGVLPSLIREITYSSIRLGGYEPIRNMLASSPGGDPSHTKDIPLWKKLSAGAIAGAIGSGLANPIDLVKVQQQAVIGYSSTVNNAQTLTMLRRIYSEQGIPGLFRGVLPTVQRAALLTATQLGTYDHIKQFLLSSEHFTEGVLLHLCSGSIAGLVSYQLPCPCLSNLLTLTYDEIVIC